MSTIEMPPAAESDTRPASSKRVSVGNALRMHPLVVLVPMIVIAALGLVAGLHRSPKYTATSAVVVEPLAPTVVQLSGAIQAAQDTATNEGRLVTADSVTGPLATQFHTTSKYIADHLTGSPIPNSTVIKIIAEGNSESSAIALANATATVFSRYVTGRLQTNAAAEKLLQSYAKAAHAFRLALQAESSLGGHTPSKKQQVEAATAVATAQVRQQALSQQYDALIQSHSTAPSVSPFVLATAATSDRAAKIEIYLFAGIVLGALIGVALATMLANRRRSN